MAKKLQRKGECPSCKGQVVGEAESNFGHCVNCGAKVTDGRGEPSDAIERAVEKVFKRYGLTEKKTVPQNDDDLE